MQKKKSYKKVFLKSVKSLLNVVPIMIGIVMLIGIIKSFISFEKVAELFTQKPVIDTILGTLIGSVLAGSSINSYIIGKEMLTSGVSLFAITAFLVAWVTVGFVQIPAEKAILGGKFTYIRNILSILLSIVIALLTVWILGVIS